jgi:alpha-galactosidase
MRVAPPFAAAAACVVCLIAFPATFVHAGAPEVVAQVETPGLRIEFDHLMRSRLVARRAAGEIPLGDFRAAEVIVGATGEISEFAIAADNEGSRSTIEDNIGTGSRLVLDGTSGTLRKELAITTYADFPALAVIEVAYTNISAVEQRLIKWINRRFVPADKDAPEPPFWAYLPGSYEKRPDWLRPLRVGFAQQNYLGMNAVDYGGGTPVVDVWRRDVGIALGHLELGPRPVALPVAMRDRAGAELAVEATVDQVLRPGERFAIPRTVVMVHAGDHFAPLSEYRRLMGRQGVHFPDFDASAYQPIWCGWGYDRQVTVAQMQGTLGKAAELGFKWAVLDDGWQTDVGDWSPDPRKFSRGDADMAALTGSMRTAGLAPMLWWTPLTAHPDSELARAHPELLLLGPDGKPQKISWWNSYWLCPAFAPVLDHTRALVTKFMGDWGYEGLKLDGQHLNAAPPCYNPAHHHATPAASSEAMPAFFKLIAETARASKPAALLELCPCGTTYSFFSLPYVNLTAASDPESSWQVRVKGKTLKALMGPRAPYFGDHVELSDHGDDFASTIGVGGVVGSQFTLPGLGKSKRRWQLTPDKERVWRRWLDLSGKLMLARGEYLGGLYDIGFDRPEAHVIDKDGRRYYAFFAKLFRGTVELRGLGPGAYRIRDYVNDRDLGNVRGPTARLPARFAKHLLLEAVPQPPGAP